ncbi:hypothetical protein A2U01_0088446 [Trifolium medium]|uniref:Uncharacterized protein n=1 Tax=Trifolium medium TaxID=97028 RepID=A0A392U273_9FABA|nr:hypothetical protein [Trifolium medium]
MEAVKMMLEFVECSKVKRLTLTPHYDPRVEGRGMEAVKMMRKLSR